MFVRHPVFCNIIILALLLACCNTPKQAQQTTNTSNVKTAVTDTAGTGNFLETLMRQYPQYFDSVLKYRREWNVQVIYTQVNREDNGGAQLKSYYFNLDRNRYFYPASTVKLPIVLLALQKLNELNIKGLDRNTTMITEGIPEADPASYNDPGSPDGRPTIAQHIKKILMVSDNDAFNRLYEFLGQEYINDQLHKKGYKDAQILHRLNIFLTEEQNRQTNAVRFPDSSNTTIYQQPVRRNTVKYAQRNDFIGNGFYRGGKLVNEPMNFSGKNRIALEDLHSILQGLFFPASQKPAQRFNLTEDDKQFVFKYMSQLPTESTYPPYAADSAYWPAYCKFLLVGGGRGELPPNIRIFNKVGDAYGHMIDVAYVVDFEHKVEFFLSAMLYCNSDGILNDDKYDYSNIGLPFLKHLGQVIYAHELKRPRKNIPDLSGLVFKYDK